MPGAAVALLQAGGSNDYSDNGQILVKSWSNIGQILAGCRPPPSRRGRFQSHDNYNDNSQMMSENRPGAGPPLLGMLLAADFGVNWWSNGQMVVK